MDRECDSAAGGIAVTILKYPLVTEKAMMMADKENTLQFLVARGATRDQIRRELETAYEQEVKSVRTMMTTKGEKKAIVRFAKEKAAEEILSRLGIM
ncbi:MAG: 50S ribosomal protein L23 [Methanomicrobiales archaeon]|nr:50S ribosomal protein L23 [Methanomicrobiales archaeon]